MIINFNHGWLIVSCLPIIVPIIINYLYESLSSTSRIALAKTIESVLQLIIVIVLAD